MLITLSGAGTAAAGAASGVVNTVTQLGLFAVALVACLPLPRRQVSAA